MVAAATREGQVLSVAAVGGRTPMGETEVRLDPMAGGARGAHLGRTVGWETGVPQKVDRRRAEEENEVAAVEGSGEGSGAAAADQVLLMGDDKEKMLEMLYRGSYVKEKRNKPQKDNHYELVVCCQ